MQADKNTMMIKRSDHKSVKPNKEAVKRRHAIEDHQAKRLGMGVKEFREVWECLGA